MPYYVLSKYSLPLHSCHDGSSYMYIKLAALDNIKESLDYRAFMKMHTYICISDMEYTPKVSHMLADQAFLGTKFQNAYPALLYRDICSLLSQSSLLSVLMGC